jgi:hypothetical protein
MKPNVDMMIENLVDATLRGDASLREKHTLRESLRALVRFAKAEQLLEIKTSVRKLTGAVTLNVGRKKVNVDALLRQGQLELNSGENLQSDSSCAKNHQK